MVALTHATSWSISRFMKTSNIGIFFDPLNYTTQ